MVYEITRREVLSNLLRFKDNLSALRHDGGQKGLRKGERTYQVLLNRHTGDMRFAKKITTLEPHLPQQGKKKGRAEDWKEVRLIVEQKEGRDVEFGLKDNKNASLNSTELDPLAWKIMQETLSILNLKVQGISKQEQGLLPEETILQDLSSIHIVLEKESIEDLPGWLGSLSREDAEIILARKPIGTYLVRRGDPNTQAALFHVAEANPQLIRSFVLSFVEGENKISDLLLLQTEKGWTLYQDDPNLTDPLYHYHPSLKLLLKSLQPKVSFPIS